MGTYIFWIIFIGLVVILIISDFNKNRHKKIDKINEISESFAVNVKPDKSKIYLTEAIKGYFEAISLNGSDDCFMIDDITWNDLNLDLIFSMMNKTYTSPGQEYLYARLHQMYQTNEKPYKFYEDLRLICQDKDKRVKISVILDNLGKIKNLCSYKIINRLYEAKTSSIFKDIVLDILLLISFSTIFVSPGIGFIAFLVMLGVMISSYFKGRAIMDENLRAFCYVHKLVKCGEELKSILSDDFVYDEDLSIIKKWAFLISSKDGSSSNPVSVILDYIRMIFHVDLIVFNIRLNLIISKKTEINSLYMNIAYVDSIISVASFVYGMPKHTRALIEDCKGVDAVGMYHPLNRNPVCNNIKNDKGVLITGSNASGKSTFLKMVGLNLIFAQAFGFALADSFAIGPVKLYTSMALNDNIIGEESYYVVESKSLKRIYDASEDYNNVFCIVDEVLRGTNTMERIAASSTILKNLSKNGTLTFVATHDRELTQLLKDYYELYYFTEEITEGKVSFPYTIIKGVSETGNAIRLLEMLGFEADVINEADSLVDYYKKSGKWVADN